MSRARKVFFWVFGVSAGLGLAIGILNLIAPDAASVSWNDENVEGVNGVLVGLVSGAIPGVVLGLIAAGITSLVSRGKSS